MIKALVLDRYEDESLLEDVDIMFGSPRRNGRRTVFVEGGEETSRKETSRRRFWVIVSPNPSHGEIEERVGLKLSTKSEIGEIEERVGLKLSTLSRTTFHFHLGANTC